MQIAFRKPHPISGSDRQIVIVKLIIWIVQHTSAGAIAFAIADQYVAAWQLFEHKREVLATGLRPTL